MGYTPLNIMSLRILVTGTTGDSMPPPYVDVQNISLLYSKAWKRLGHNIGVTFVYRPDNSDDLGAKADYFFNIVPNQTNLRSLSFWLNIFL